MESQNQTGLRTGWQHLRSASYRFVEASRKVNMILRIGRLHLLRIGCRLLYWSGVIAAIVGYSGAILCFFGLFALQFYVYLRQGETPSYSWNSVFWRRAGSALVVFPDITDSFFAAFFGWPFDWARHPILAAKAACWASLAPALRSDRK